MSKKRGSKLFTIKKRAHIPAFFAVLLLAVTPGVWAHGGDHQENDPIAVVESFHRALAEGDRETALACLDPEVLIFESGGAELSREEYASHHLGSDMKFAAATKRKTNDRESGGTNKAYWVLSRSETTGTWGDREIDMVGTETMLLRRSKEGWRIFHIHWSSRSRKASH